MAKVNVRKETGKLVIDFTYRGVRCREQTALDDGAGNRKRVEAVLKKLREAIAAGTFVYGESFSRERPRGTVQLSALHRLGRSGFASAN